jgi:hypothetical protein
MHSARTGRSRVTEYVRASFRPTRARVRTAYGSGTGSSCSAVTLAAAAAPAAAAAVPVGLPPLPGAACGRAR